MKKKGFTLIELLIVMLIVLLLAAIGIISYNKALDTSDIAHGKSDMAQIAKAITVAQFNEGRPLRDRLSKISGGDGCYGLEACYKDYRASHGLTLDLRNIPGSFDSNGDPLPGNDPCMDQWHSILTEVDYFGGPNLKLTNFLRDPWGSPYVYRVNDGCPRYITDRDRCFASSYYCLPDCVTGTSCPNPHPQAGTNACCQNDDLFSVGPDGFEGTADDFTFGSDPRPHISVGLDGVPNNADDDFGGLVPRAYTGACEYQRDTTHSGAPYCQGQP